MTERPAFVAACAAALLAGAVGLTACSCSRSSADRSANDTSPAPPASGAPLVHPTGIILAPQPAEYATRETEAGIRVEPANARLMRSPWSVELRLTEINPLNGSDLERTKIADRDAHYRVSVDDGVGSGGPLYTLTASSACGAKVIVLTATQQAEPPEKPDWSRAWAILAAARCEMRK